MPRRVVIKARFQRAYDRLPADDQARVKSALHAFHAFHAYLASGDAPLGLGLRKLTSDVYEFRVGLALRVVVVEEREVLALALLGSHDEVHRFLRRS